MFNVFNASYRETWNIPFKDVISLTNKIDFQKNSTTIPILEKLKELHFEGFESYWGNGFAGFARVVLTNGLDRKGTCSVIEKA